VGAISVKGGIGVDGLSVTFMKIEDDGLNPKDAYQSPSFGTAVPDTQLGGDGSPIVGIYGHHDGQKIMAIGVVAVEKSQ
jgi:hypothetical protein